MISNLRVAALAVVSAFGTLIPCLWAAQNFSLDSAKGLQPHDVTVEAATYHGRKAVKVVPAPAPATKTDEGGGIAVLSGPEFHNGTIEVDVAGKPGAGAPAEARGFVGVAFRVAADASKY
jgi:hypothetical protein